MSGHSTFADSKPSSLISSLTIWLDNIILLILSPFYW